MVLTAHLGKNPAPLYELIAGPPYGEGLGKVGVISVVLAGVSSVVFVDAVSTSCCATGDAKTCASRTAPAKRNFPAIVPAFINVGK